MFPAVSCEEVILGSTPSVIQNKRIELAMQRQTQIYKNCVICSCPLDRTFRFLRFGVGFTLPGEVEDHPQFIHSDRNFQEMLCQRM